MSEYDLTPETNEPATTFEMHPGECGHDRGINLRGRHIGTVTINLLTDGGYSDAVDELSSNGETTLACGVTGCDQATTTLTLMADGKVDVANNGVCLLQRSLLDVLGLDKGEL